MGVMRGTKIMGVMRGTKIMGVMRGTNIPGCYNNFLLYSQNPCVFRGAPDPSIEGAPETSKAVK
jgi:hypothetical protein